MKTHNAHSVIELGDFKEKKIITVITTHLRQEKKEEEAHGAVKNTGQRRNSEPVDPGLPASSTPASGKAGGRGPLWVGVLSPWLDKPRLTFPKNPLPSIALQGKDLLHYLYFPKALRTPLKVGSGSGRDLLPYKETLTSPPSQTPVQRASLL